MPRSAYVYQPEAAVQIVAYLRSGGFPEMAAEATGVPREVFWQWLAWGEKKRSREPFRTFARDVRKAIAQGRLKAEIAVYKKDPKSWLMNGPGKETAETPGWSSPVRPSSQKRAEDRAGLEQAKLAAGLLQALAPFPEARVAAARVLSNKGKPKKRRAEAATSPER
jgi:hypothetical protein